MVADALSAYGLTITALLPHPQESYSILATTNKGLYKIDNSSCILLFASPTIIDSDHPCFDINTITSNDVGYLYALESVDFTKDTELEGSNVAFEHVANAILIADKDSHCVHLIDLDSTSHQVFLGDCGNMGYILFNSAPSISDAELNSPTAVVYVNKEYITDSYSWVLVFRPCYSGFAFYNNQGCYTACALNRVSSTIKCSAHSISLHDTFRGPVRAIHYYGPGEVVKFVYNSNCGVNCEAHSQFEATSCIKSFAFINGTGYLIAGDGDGKLYSTDLTSQGGILNKEAACAYSGTNCVRAGYTILSSHATTNFILAFKSDENEIHKLGITTTQPLAIQDQETTWNRPATISHARFRLYDISECGTEYIWSANNLTIEDCVYLCAHEDFCISFSYTPNGACSLHSSYLVRGGGEPTIYIQTSLTVCYTLHDWESK